MPHALLTFIAPLAPDRVAEAAAVLDTLGNPATQALHDRLAVLDDAGNGLHFASMHAIASADGSRGYLILECSMDGTEARAIAHLVTAEAWLRPVLLFATDWSDGTDLGDWLRRHKVTIGTGWFDNPGVAFDGTPGFSVGRILSEARLARALGPLVVGQGGHRTALDALNAVRRQIAADSTLSPMLEAGPQDPLFTKPAPASFIAGLIAPFITHYLWPLVILILLWTLGHGAWSALHAVPGHGLGRLFIGLWVGLRQSVCASIGLTVLVAAAAYLTLRRLENTDVPSNAAIDRATNAAMFARENQGAQNHMISVTQRKPGLVRGFTSRLIFWAIGESVASKFPPGFLGDISSIHFARWVTAPASRDVIFMSNYDGSWESYLEDFITLAHIGLTGVWSNSIGFPRTENLINLGATDGERFKRFARHSMTPTRFWFSAYPSLTTANIRANALIRQGLAGAMTENEAINWLDLFGAAVRPPNQLVESDIQSLILGGLGFLAHGACRIGTLPANDAPDASGVAAARHWLAAVAPEIAFADGRRIEKDAVLTLGLTANGLAKLGLPSAALASFSFTFLEGIATEARGRILGDVGANAPDQWRWGRESPDVVLLVYGHDAEAVARLEQRLDAWDHLVGPTPIDWRRIPLQPVQATEPFGFADGLSQPVIRGTYKATRGVDPIHIVAAGEFVLGYPDNRGNLPPGPTLAATDDPAALLPIALAIDGFKRTMVEAPRDLGCDGSYLVIRELEQNVAAFRRYCEEQADALRAQNKFHCPVTPEFVGAKMVGRWQDGAPLVRHPFLPPEPERHRYDPHGQVTRKMSALGTHSGHRLASHRPAHASEANPAAGTSSTVDHRAISDGYIENDFLFGREDPQAMRCPYGAHVRRANPRDSFDPGSADQIAISNRHRIIRVGRRFQPAAGQDPGLLFMCLNGDIERQFEFLQQTWVGNTSFHGLANEEDPLVGRGLPGTNGLGIPTPYGPARLAPIDRFVTTKGGGYFFLPGRRLIEFLCQQP